MKGHKSTKRPGVKLRAVPAKSTSGDDLPVAPTKGKQRAVAAEDGMDIDEDEVVADSEEDEPKPLLGKLLCISGYREIRADLLHKARDLGADISPELTLDTSYLISEANVESGKVKSAREHSIPVVLSDFIEVMCGAWQRGERVEIDQLALEHAAFPPAKLLDGYSIAITDFPSHPKSTRIDLIESIVRNGGDYHPGLKRVTAVLLVGRRQLDKQRRNEGKPSEKIEVGQRWIHQDSQADRTPILRIVWGEWLTESLAARRILPLDDFDHSRPIASTSRSPPSSGNRILHEDTIIADEPSVSLSKNRSLKRSHALDNADDAVEQVAAKKRHRSDQDLDVDTLLLRKLDIAPIPPRAPLAQASSFASFAQPESDSLMPPPVRDATVGGSMLQKLQAGRSATLVSNAPARKPLQRTASAPAPSPSPPLLKQIFRDLVFTPRGLSDDIVVKLPQIIRSRGGRFTLDMHDPEITHVVIPWSNPRPGDIDEDDTRNVAIFWIERCCFEQQLLPLSHWTAEPHRFLTPIPSATSYTVAWSGFDQCDAQLVSRICKSLGLPSTTDVSKATHCIFSGNDEGAAKAKQARAANVPLVDIDWLLDLVTNNPLAELKSQRRSIKAEASQNRLYPRPLLGLGIAIGKSCATQRSKLCELITETGATVLPLNDPKTTHLLHTGTRTNDVSAECKTAREAGLPICHPKWLEVCAAQHVHADEQQYPHTLSATRALTFGPSALPASSSRMASRSPSRGLSVPPALPASAATTSTLKSSHGEDEKPMLMVAKASSPLRHERMLEDPAFDAAPVPPPLVAALPPPRGSPPPPVVAQSAPAKCRETSASPQPPVRQEMMAVDKSMDASEAMTMHFHNEPSSTTMTMAPMASTSMSSSSHNPAAIKALLAQAQTAEDSDSAAVKMRKKERYLARKRSSATSAGSRASYPPEGQSDDAPPSFARSAAAHVKGVVEEDEDPASAYGGESLMVSYLDPAQKAARKQLLEGAQRHKTKVAVPEPIREEPTPSPTSSGLARRR